MNIINKIQFNNYKAKFNRRITKKNIKKKILKTLMNKMKKNYNYQLMKI